MKKQKALEDMTHQDLFEAIIYDENIQDNLNVSDDYSEDKYGNKIITFAFVGSESRLKKSSQAMMMFLFNKKGRLVSVEVATKVKGDRNWQVASSDALLDFTSRFGSDAPVIKKKKKS